MPAVSGHIRPGSLLGGSYQVLRSIGQGRMGEVFEATHTRLAGRYAVKVLAPEVRNHPDFLERFAREAKVTSSLRHPGIVQVIDFDTTPDGSSYLVVEFLEGETLGQVLAREGRLPLGRTIAITRQIASALAAAHRQEVLHRDLTPRNIFLLPAVEDEKERVKVLDFGISKMRFASQTAAGLAVVAESPEVMAPEQAAGDEDVDAGVDQFSLAAIVYQMLAGQPAFKGESATTVTYRIIYDDPVPLRQLRPELPAGIDAVLARALSKNRALRFPSIGEFSRELRVAAQTGAVAAPADELDSRGSAVTAVRALPPGTGRADAEGGVDAKGDGRDGRPAVRPPEESAPVVLQGHPLTDRAVLVAGGARAAFRQTGALSRTRDEHVPLDVRARFREVLRSRRARPVLGGVGGFVLLVVVIALLRGGRSTAPTATAMAAPTDSTVASGQVPAGTAPSPGQAAPAIGTPKAGPTIQPIVEPMKHVDDTAAAAPSEAAATQPALAAAMGGTGGAADETGGLAFELASEPAGLPVWIDGKPYPDAEHQAHTSTRGTLSVGAHRIEILAKDGYEPWRKTVDIRADRANRFLARLKEKDPAEIFQELTPPSTGKPVATAQPAAALNEAGLVPAALVKPAAPPVTPPLVSPGPCSLSVGSLPWATIWVDGQSTGRHTPTVALPLPCGKHQLHLKRDDQPIDFTTEIVLLPGKPLKRVFNFDATGRRLAK